jgi:dephospho-CoA kinase
MLKVGLTGGIAAGKSVVGEMFVVLGAHLIQADRIAYALMQPGEAVYNEVVLHFGRKILNADGSINRAKLAEVVFGATDAPDGQPASRIGELNCIIHPVVLRNQDAWMREMGRQDPRGVAIVEAALILEAGAAKQFDRLIVVTCSEEQRAARFAARHQMELDAARKEVTRRMAAQLPEKEKIKAADYIIDNSGSLDHTREQVSQVWQHLRAEAGKS